MSQNIRIDRPSFVTHLECALTGEHYPSDRLMGLSDHGKPLLVRYDLEAIGRSLTKQDLQRRAPDMWRYRELLPVRKSEHIVSLGEMMTPLLSAPRTAAAIGAGALFVKDDGRLPTGSFKARGLAVAVSMAKAFGVTRIALPTAGNAGAALAAYCARAGIEAFIFYPDDPESGLTVSDIILFEIPLYGAHGFSVNKVISELGPVIEGGREPLGWFNMSTLKEPYRIEGKKTIAFELAEQFDWDLPDVIFYPTGGGTGLIAIWKALAELEAIGWIGAKRPRLVAVQSKGCAPIVRAFEQGARFAEPFEDAHTSIAGMRVTATVGDFLMLDAIRESGGFAVGIEEAEVEEERRRMASLDGINLCTEGAALLLACREALADGRVDRSERIVLFNSASGLKSPMAFEKPRLDVFQPVDYAALLRS